MKSQKQRENLESNKWKVTSYIQRNFPKITSGFFSRNLGGEESGMIFKVLEYKSNEPRILFSAKLSFRTKEIKIFPNKSWGNSSSLDLPCKNVERSFSSLSERTLISSIKTWKYNTHCKRKYVSLTMLL